MIENSSSNMVSNSGPCCSKNVKLGNNPFGGCIDALLIFKDTPPESNCSSFSEESSNMDVSNSDDCLVHQALSNPVVLSNVFEFLPVEEVKEMRTVCKDWEVPASSVLGKRTHLNVKLICEDCYSGFTIPEVLELPKIKRQLLRRIRIKDMSPKSDGLLSNASPDLDKYEQDQIPGLIFLKTHSDWIQEIQFCVDWDFGPTMTILFENLVFPNLKKISMLEASHWTTFQFPIIEAENFRPQNIPQLTKIRELEYDAAVAEKAGQFQNGHPYLFMFQELLIKSPNLERLTITGNVYPDLSSVSNLKRLILTAFPLLPLPADIDNDTDDDDDPMMVRKEFSNEKLQQMLGQVSNRLEELILNSTVKDRDGDDFDSQFLDYDDDEEIDNLPYFPKLISLTINPVNGFILKFSLSHRNFPLLRKLNLVMRPVHYNDGLDEIIKFLGTWDTVKEISFNVFLLGNENGVRCLRKMATTFPNITKLVVTWCGASIIIEKVKQREDTFFDWLKELQRSWILEDLTIRLDAYLTSSQLMEGIVGANFRGLNTLKLVATEGKDVTDDGCKNFEAVFRAIPMVSFKGFLFKPSTVIRMLDFFEVGERKDRLCFCD